MAWYRAGTVSVANGSAVVTGANTDFVSNTQQGEAFLGPDGRVYEVAQVVSATQLTLGGNYQGASAGGQGYALMPTSSFARDLALGAAQLLNTFAAVRDGVGAGLFADGSAATPGLRFAADQDTGITRVGENSLGISTGGVIRVQFDGAGQAAFPTAKGMGTLGLAGEVFTTSDGQFGPRLSTDGTFRICNAANTIEMFRFGAGGFLGVGTTASRAKLEIYRTVPNVSNIILSSSFMPASYIELNAGVAGVSNGGFDMRLGGTSRFIVDDSGNFIVGDTVGSSHKVRKNGAQGSQCFEVFASAAFFNSDGSGFNGAATAMVVTRNTTTSRSINAAGTINASGADYAEYMRKADGCGTIAKGDVCGVDVDGHLTRTWSAAISHVVKSTDPSIVGGDVWAGHLGPRPEQPRAEPLAPGEAPVGPGPAPERPAEDADAAEFDRYETSTAAYAELVADWQRATAAHAEQVKKFPSDHAAWEAEQAAYVADVRAWEADLETARQCVDRIAFSGQVWVNVTGAFAVGDYIVAAANGSGIKAIAVAEADITFDQYRRRIGKVWAVRDGRAWVDVQHG